MYIGNPASPTTSNLAGSEGLSIHPQSDCGQGSLVKEGSAREIMPGRAVGKLSNSGGRLWSVGLSEPVTNSAINFLLINHIDSYSLITFWGNSDEARKFPWHV